LPKVVSIDIHIQQWDFLATKLQSASISMKEQASLMME